jgi:hypothetical protein
MGTDLFQRLDFAAMDLKSITSWIALVNPAHMPNECVSAPQQQQLRK